MYKVEVIADSSGKWVGNGVTHRTSALAEGAARDLFARWMLVRAWRIVEVETGEVIDGVGENWDLP